MGIKTVKYKANSIVYFKGDIANRVYILKKGSIVTKSNDLKTDDDILTMIKVGEFIGVKNVISNQQYSETVSTLTDTELVVFNKEDFENFILTNSRVMMQTLVVFSNQLRKIHKDIKELNQEPDDGYSVSNSEKDLFELGRFFKKQNKDSYGDYCFKKYQELYPNGEYAKVVKNSNKNSNFLEKEELDNIENEIELLYQESQNYLSEKNYTKALQCLEKVITAGGGVHKEDAIYFKGLCLYKLKQYKGCIQNYSDFISQNKEYPKINEVIFYVGCSYKEIGDNAQASLFLKQVIKRSGSSPLAQIASKELKGI